MFKGLNTEKENKVMLLFLVIIIVGIVFLISINDDLGPSKATNFSLKNEENKDFLLVRPIKFSNEVKDVYRISLISDWYLISKTGWLPVTCDFITIESWRSLGKIQLLTVSYQELASINLAKFNGIDSLAIVLSGNDKEIKPVVINQGHVGVGLFSK